MLPSVDSIIIKQLRDCANKVSQKKEKYAISEMYSCEQKFVIDTLKKWLVEKYFSRHKELDFFTKQQFKKKNPIDWEKTKCTICSFHLPTPVSNFPSEEITTFLDFEISKEHSFFRNIFDYEELKLSKNISTLEKYHQAFKKMLRIVVLLNTNYAKGSDVEDISDDCMIEFINKININ